MQATPSASATSTAAPSRGPTLVYDRPPPGLRRGPIATSQWVVGGVAVALVVFVVVFYVVRWRRARAKRYESVAPQSIPPSSRR